MGVCYMLDIGFEFNFVYVILFDFCIIFSIFVVFYSIEDDEDIDKEIGFNEVT